MLRELQEQEEAFLTNESKDMSEAPELTDFERHGDKGKRIKLKKRDPWLYNLAGEPLKRGRKAPAQL